MELYLYNPKKTNSDYFSETVYNLILMFAVIFVHIGQQFDTTGGAPCDSYPCGTRACTNIDSVQYQCDQLAGRIECGFEQWDTQCSALLDINVEGDDYDPIYNTGKSCVSRIIF